MYTQLTTNEVTARIARMSARPDLHRVPVVGTTEDIADVSREVAAQLYAPGDGCWYLARYYPR